MWIIIIGIFNGLGKLIRTRAYNTYSYSLQADIFRGKDSSMLANYFILDDRFLFFLLQVHFLTTSLFSPT